MPSRADTAVARTIGIDTGKNTLHMGNWRRATASSDPVRGGAILRAYSTRPRARRHPQSARGKADVTASADHQKTWLLRHQTP